MIKKIFKRIWAYWFYICFGGIFLLFYPLFFFLLLNKKTYPLVSRLRRIWAKLIFFLMGIRVNVHFEKKIFLKETYIFMSNHTSYLDIPCFAYVVEGYLHFMAKIELTKVPLFKKFFTTIDIPIDRSSSIASYRAFQKAAKNLCDNKSIVIFPEGGASGKDYSLQDFKKQPFILAIETGVPIVPVTFLDNWSLFLDDGRNFAKSGKSRVFLHKPILTKDINFDEVDELKQRVFDIINKPLLEEYEGR